MDQVASFHLVRERRGRQLLVLLRLLRDRRVMRTVEGLEWCRVLGTGRGDRTAPGVDLRRSAMFAVWRDQAALDVFLSTHTIPRRWRQSDGWHVALRPIEARGSWNDRSIPITDAFGSDRAGAVGPVVVLTRATVRIRHWPAFARRSGRVDRVLRAEPGLRAIVGVGEVPLGRIGTLSVWDSASSARSFATGPGHDAARRAERAGHWFAEELFAWFEPTASHGSWDGRDPVAQT